MGKPLILIVDDDPNAQKLMELILRSDYRTRSAESLGQARKALVGERPSVIILDMNLKGHEDGLDLVREMRQDAELADLPVIGLSGHDAPEYEDAALEAGCNVYLTKPIRRDYLLEQLQSLALA